jgi:hypothetical protein
MAFDYKSITEMIIKKDIERAERLKRETMYATQRIIQKDLYRAKQQKELYLKESFLK